MQRGRLAGRQHALLRHADGRPRAGHRHPKRGQDATLLLILNGFHDVVKFTLPESPGGGGWELLLDTNAPDQEERPSFKFGDEYEVTGRSLLLFLMRPKRAASGTGRRR